MDNMTLEEALAAADVSTTPVNDILMVDAEARTIIVPASEMLFGVRQDMDAERKYFKCPKIVGDNVDLSKCHIYISYVPSKQDGTYDINEDVGAYLCEDLDVDGDYVTFSWKLSGNVFVKAGYIAFAVYAKQADADGNLQTKWHTTFAIGKVLDTLPDGEQIVEKYADVIEQLLNRMDEVEAIATPEAMQNYIEAYLVENPPSGMTAEEKEQLDKNTEDISSLSEEIVNLKTSGLTTTQVNALDGMFKKCAFTEDVTEEYEAFKNAFGIGESGGEDVPDEPDNPEVILSSISATYIGGDVVVGTALTNLIGITVTAHYSDGSTENVTGYTLSGEIVEGENTITVTYEGLTTTFAVTGFAEGEVVTYTITRNLENCSSSSTLSSVVGGTSHSEILTAESGYTMMGATITITMGGVDVTENFLSGRTIVFEAVTGDIVISASAIIDNRTLLYNWDLTKSLIDTVGGKEITLNGATQDSNGLKLDSINAYATFPEFIISRKEVTIEVDFGEMSRQGNVHGRLVMFNESEGFIYRNTGSWQIYSGQAWSGAVIETNANAFDNSTIVIKQTGTFTNTTGEHYWEIEHNGNVIAPIRKVGGYSFDALTLGQSTNSYYNAVIKAIRIYEGV